MEQGVDVDVDVVGALPLRLTKGPGVSLRQPFVVLGDAHACS